MVVRRIGLTELASLVKLATGDESPKQRNIWRDVQFDAFTIQRERRCHIQALTHYIQDPSRTIRRDMSRDVLETV